MDLLKHLLNQIAETSLIERLAFLFGVFQVILAWKKRSINFYAGIISVLLYTIVFYKAGLFAESILNAYYFIVSILGIYLWKKNNSIPIRFSSKKEHIIAMVIFALALSVQYVILKHYTSSTVPFYDALTAAFAWAGSWLLIQKKVENWIWLNAANAIAIPLQWHKGLELTALLTCIYFLVAILGFFGWKKEANASNELDLPYG